MSTWLIWIIITALLLIIEVLAQQVCTFCLALGCIAALVLDLCGVALSWQLVALGVAAVVAYAIIVPKVKAIHQRALERAGRLDRTGMEALLGRRAVVTETIRPGHTGRCRIDGDSWQVRCPGASANIERGAEIVITAFDSIILEGNRL